MPIVTMKRSILVFNLGWISHARKLLIDSNSKIPLQWQWQRQWQWQWRPYNVIFGLPIPPMQDAFTLSIFLRPLFLGIEWRPNTVYLIFSFFLVACTRLYNPLCPSLGRSVGPKLLAFFLSFYAILSHLKSFKVIFSYLKLIQVKIMSNSFSTVDILFQFYCLCYYSLSFSISFCIYFYFYSWISSRVRVTP